VGEAFSSMFQRALAMTTDEDSLYTQQKTQLVVMETRMEDLQRQIKKLGETVTERDATIVEKEEKEREMYITVRRAEGKVKKAVEARDKAFKEAAVAKQLKVDKAELEAVVKDNSKRIHQLMDDLEDKDLETRSWQKKWELESKVGEDLHRQLTEVQTKLQKMSQSDYSPHGVARPQSSAAPTLTGGSTAVSLGLPSPVGPPAPTAASSPPSAEAAAMDDEIEAMKAQMNDKASSLQHLMQQDEETWGNLNADIDDEVEGVTAGASVAAKAIQRHASGKASLAAEIEHHDAAAVPGGNNEEVVDEATQMAEQQLSRLQGEIDAKEAELRKAEEKAAKFAEEQKMLEERAAAPKGLNRKQSRRLEDLKLLAAAEEEDLTKLADSIAKSAKQVERIESVPQIPGVVDDSSKAALQEVLLQVAEETAVMKADEIAATENQLMALQNDHIHLEKALNSGEFSKDKTQEMEALKKLGELKLEMDTAKHTKHTLSNGPGSPGAFTPLAFSTVNIFAMAFLYGRAGRLTAENGGVRPGQTCSWPSPKSRHWGPRSAAAQGEARSKRRRWSRLPSCGDTPPVRARRARPWPQITAERHRWRCVPFFPRSPVVSLFLWHPHTTAIRFSTMLEFCG
jgi:hypothetical protein